MSSTEIASRRILIIDDDLELLNTFRYILQRNGFDASTASTAGDALERLRTETSFDFVMTDLRLPDTSGLHLLKWIRTHHTHVPCAIATAYWSAESEFEALSLGACLYLEKPIWEEDLLASVHRCMKTVSWRVSEALRIIDQRYREPAFGLGLVARHFGVTEEHMSRLLTKETGYGFEFRLHFTRVREARRLLANSNLTIKEIAAAVGYASTKRLDVHFNKFCDTTPGIYRQRVRQ